MPSSCSDLELSLHGPLLKKPFINPDDEGKSSTGASSREKGRFRVEKQQIDKKTHLSPLYREIIEFEA